MIGIVDSGYGNLRSVKKALDYIGAKSAIVATPREILGCSAIVLPGVGAFGTARKILQKSGTDQAILECISQNRPFLGICLGMQLLMSGSEESAKMAGLGVFEGRCIRFKHGKVPHTGWNQISKTSDSALLKRIDDGTHFYFVHSYHIPNADKGIVSAISRYHVDFAAAIEYRKTWAVQFHPEKSGRAGLMVLENWLRAC